MFWARLFELVGGPPDRHRVLRQVEQVDKGPVPREEAASIERRNAVTHAADDLLERDLGALRAAVGGDEKPNRGNHEPSEACRETDIAEHEGADGQKMQCDTKGERSG